MFYSVPHQYIKNKVDVRITDTTIDIFHNHKRIASHRRVYGRSSQYSPVTEHMPQDHQKYLEWNGDRFRRWADSIGINTSARVLQQSYRSYIELLKLDEKYSQVKLKQTCTKALAYSSHPNYKSINNPLAAMKGEPEPTSGTAPSCQAEARPHVITRGARYYGGRKSWQIKAHLIN